ncbi:MAG: hypothetical protein WC471_05645 [Candidatus Woesearchaeota archaeon]
MLDKLNSENRWTYAAFAIAIVVMFSVQIIRFVHEDSVPIGEESYYHIKIAKQVIEDRVFVFSPFHLLIAFIGFFIGLKLVWILLPIIVSLLLLQQFQLFLKELNFDNKEIFMVSAFFILSPVFILFSASLNVYFFSLALMLQGILALSRNEFTKANVIFAIVSLSSFYSAIVLLAFLLVYYARNHNKDLIYSMISIFFLAIIAMETIPTDHGVINLVTDLIGDLGGLLGFNIYTLILFLIGFELSWDYKANLAYIYMFMVGLFGLAVGYNLSIDVFLLLPVCMFAVYGFIYLLQREWSSPLIRDLILLTLMSGLVISGIGSIKQVAYAEPNSGIYESLAGLDTYTDNPEYVFSYYDRSEWIEGISGMPALYDYDNKNEEMTLNIFQSKNFEKVIDFLKENHVRYIWFDEAMKKEFWPDREKGLLFFLNNKDNFEEIYSSKDAELWKFIGDEQE